MRIEAIKVVRMAVRNNFRFKLNRYPAIVGVGRFTSEDNVAAIDVILALALLSTKSI